MIVTHFLTMKDYGVVHVSSEFRQKEKSCFLLPSLCSSKRRLQHFTCIEKCSSYGGRTHIKFSFIFSIHFDTLAPGRWRKGAMEKRRNIPSKIIYRLYHLLPVWKSARKKIMSTARLKSAAMAISAISRIMYGAATGLSVKSWSLRVVQLRSMLWT